MLVEQYLDFARELGDRFVVMDRGAIGLQHLARGHGRGGAEEGAGHLRARRGGERGGVRRTDLIDTCSRPTARRAGLRSRSMRTAGSTRRDKVYEHGPLRVRFPNTDDGALEAVFVNTAGGIAGGDRHDLEMAAGESTALTVTTAAAEKVYRSLGPAAEIAIKLAAAAIAALLAAAGDDPVRPRAACAPDRGRS